MARITMEFDGDFDEHEADAMFDEAFEAMTMCGRWRNGRLVKQCLKAGDEDCRFCPYNRTR